MTEKNYAAELLEKMNNEYIEENIETLQEYFMKNDERGMMCNKDNIEDEFDRWLSKQEYKDLRNIILTTKHHHAFSSKEEEDREMEMIERELQATQNHYYENN